MKLYSRELRFECLKLAVGMVNAKHVKVDDLFSKADELFDYVDTDPGDEDDAAEPN